MCAKSCLNPVNSIGRQKTLVEVEWKSDVWKSDVCGRSETKLAVRILESPGVLLGKWGLARRLLLLYQQKLALLVTASTAATKLRLTRVFRMKECTKWLNAHTVVKLIILNHTESTSANLPVLCIELPSYNAKPLRLNNIGARTLRADRTAYEAIRTGTTIRDKKVLWNYAVILNCCRCNRANSSAGQAAQLVNSNHPKNRGMHIGVQWKQSIKTICSYETNFRFGKANCNFRLYDFSRNSDSLKKTLSKSYGRARTPRLSCTKENGAPVDGSYLRAIQFEITKIGLFDTHTHD